LTISAKPLIGGGRFDSFDLDNALIRGDSVCIIVRASRFKSVLRYQ
jgi:hypothetical protein